MDSIRMTEPRSMVAMTMMIGMTLGTMCLKIFLEVLIPVASAASMYSISLTESMEPLTMRASGVPVQVMPSAADHVLPPMVGNIAPDVLTAQDGAAPERVELAMSAEAKAIYPRFVQIGDTVYIYRPMRWRQEGDTVYLDYTEAAWEAPEEDGDALIVRQVYSAAENGDYLEVT